MDFYTIVIILAIIVLILLLTYIGIAMSSLKQSQVFPERANACPDYWEQTSDGKCVFPAKDTKNNGYFTVGTDLYNGNTYVSGVSVGEGLNKYSYTDTVYLNGQSMASVMNPSVATYVSGTQIKEVIDINDESKWNGAGSGELSGLPLACAKKKWALKNGIAWDGITNSNLC